LPAVKPKKGATHSFTLLAAGLLVGGLQEEIHAANLTVKMAYSLPG